MRRRTWLRSSQRSGVGTKWWAKAKGCQNLIVCCIRNEEMEIGSGREGVYIILLLVVNFMCITDLIEAKGMTQLRGNTLKWRGN